MSKHNILRSELEKADRVEITSIVDNYSDALLASSESKSDLVTRATEKDLGGRVAGVLLAEHA